MKALADATKNLKKSKPNLINNKSKKQGRASQKAVDLAITQLTLATVGVATATTNLAMAVKKIHQLQLHHHLEQECIVQLIMIQNIIQTS